MKRAPHIVNVSELEWTRMEGGECFAVDRKQLGGITGGQQLGTSLIRLEPGKRSWPLHYHFANEEAIYIVEGSGTLRTGDREDPVAKGDYIAFPTGPAHAHQMINTSSADLVYLCVSTMTAPDVSYYPDSGKIGVITGSAPGGDPKKRVFAKFFPENADVDYWEGEH